MASIRTNDSPVFKYTLGDVGIYPKMFHAHIELYFLLNGTVEYLCESGRFPLAPHTLVLIPQGVYHQFWVQGNKPEYERFVIELPSDGYFANHFADLFVHWSMVHLSATEPLFDALMRLKKYNEEVFSLDRNELTVGVCTEILSLLRHKQPLPSSSVVPADSLSSKAMEYIHTHLNESLSLQEIARACYVATSTLSHSFRKSYGISVTQYVRQKKMALAKHYLIMGKTPGEASILCGYTEYSTFFRAFTKEYGYAPYLEPKQ